MTCNAFTRRGKACRARTLPQDTKCFAHTSDAAVAVARDAGRKDGGTARGKQLAARNTQDPPASGAAQDLELLTEQDCEDCIREIALSALRGTTTTREASAKTKIVLALAKAIRASEKETREDEAHEARMRR